MEEKGEEGKGGRGEKREKQAMGLSPSPREWAAKDGRAKGRESKGQPMPTPINQPPPASPRVSPTHVPLLPLSSWSRARATALT